MKPDETPLPQPEAPADAPFEFGDRTMLALRSQSFAIENEYGTMILPLGGPPPVSLETTEMPMPAMPPLPALEAHPPSVDPLVRLEEKIDTALRLIHSLQQKLDSLDATLARSLNRS